MFFFFLFFFLRSVGWLCGGGVGCVCVCVCGGGGGMGICTPTLFTQSNPYIFVWVWWLKGQAGYPGLCISSTDDYQTSQKYFCSFEITCIKLKVLFVCFGVLRPSQHYLGYF